MLINRNILRTIINKAALKQWQDRIKKVNKHYSLLFFPSDTGMVFCHFLPHTPQVFCCGIHSTFDSHIVFNYRDYKMDWFKQHIAKIKTVPCECKSGLDRLKIEIMDILHPENPYYRKKIE